MNLAWVMVASFVGTRNVRALEGRNQLEDGVG